jgi:hypothetical protein
LFEEIAEVLARPLRPKIDRAERRRRRPGEEDQRVGCLGLAYLKETAMRRLAFAAMTLVVVSVSVYIARAQTPTPRNRVVWQYGYFIQDTIGSKTFSSFITKSEKGGSGQSLEEFLKSRTGKEFVGTATYVDVLDSLGSSGWELIQLTNERGSSGPKTTYYFKRLAN